METKVNRSITKAHTVGTGVQPFQSPLKDTPNVFRGIDQPKDLFEVSKQVSKSVAGSLPGGIQGEAHVAAQASVDGQAGFDVHKTGATAAAAVHAEATVEAGASAVRDFGNKGEVEAEVQVEAGAEAQGTARVDVGLKGAEVELHGDAFIGARAEASIEGTLGDGLATAEAGVTGLAGIGAEGEISADIGWDNIEFQVQGGLAFGLGASVDFSVSVDPGKVFDTAKDAVTDRLDDVRDAVTDKLGDVRSAVSNKINDVRDWF